VLLASAAKNEAGSRDDISLPGGLAPERDYRTLVQEVRGEAVFPGDVPPSAPRFQSVKLNWGTSQDILSSSANETLAFLSPAITSNSFASMA
jgi:hypothetical protein